MNTLTRDAVNKFNQWSKYIHQIANFDLSKVDKNTLFGKIIIEGFNTDPETAIKMIQDQHKDNPEMIEQIIGTFNTKLICG